MSKADLAYERSIIKMPVDGPAPNNTLVFIRAWLPASGSDGAIAPGGIQSFFEGEDDTEISRKRLTFPSLRHRSVRARKLRQLQSQHTDFDRGLSRGCRPR